MVCAKSNSMKRIALLIATAYLVSLSSATTYISHGIEKKFNNHEAWFEKNTHVNVESAVEFFNDVYIFTKASDACANRTKYCKAASEDAVTCSNATEHSWVCKCTDGYKSIDGNGLNCDDKDECAENTHACNTTETCINLAGRYKCDCLGNNEIIDGMCDHNECLTVDGACGTYAKCKNTLGAFECDCMDNYLKHGNRCSEALCNTVPDRCGSHSNCVDLVTASGLSFNCSCDPGYKSDVGGRDCYDVDECNDSLLYNCTYHSTCKNLVGKYECQCDDHYLRQGHQCVNDPCYASPCGTYYICDAYQDSDDVWKRKCTCEKGLVNNGAICEDINECLDNNVEKCTENAVCVNTFGSYFCKCKKNFLKTHSGHCFANPCKENGDCGKNSVCNVIDSYSTFTSKCSCIEGYDSYNYKDCKDINECTRGAACPEFSSCKNTPGSYLCECHATYLKTSSGQCIRRPCENHACGPQSSCHDKDNGRSWVAECYCDSGYSVANGTCDDSDECLSSPCPAHSTCANTQGSYVCTCDSTYLPENDVCVRDPCLIGIPCGSFSECTSDLFDKDSREKWLPTCSCYSGFASENRTSQINCTDIDECKYARRPGCSGTALCVNTEGSFYWKCNGDYIKGMTTTTTTTATTTTIPSTRATTVNTNAPAHDNNNMFTESITTETKAPRTHVVDTPGKLSDINKQTTQTSVGIKTKTGSHASKARLSLFVGFVLGFVSTILNII